MPDEALVMEHVRVGRVIRGSARPGQHPGERPVQVGIAALGGFLDSLMPTVNGANDVQSSNYEY